MYHHHTKPQSLLVVVLVSLVLLLFAISPTSTVLVAAVRERRGIKGSGTQRGLQQQQVGECTTHGGFDTINECSQGPWPSCICATGTACKAHILSLDPSLQGKTWIIRPGTAVKKNKRTDRVRIFVDDTGLVVSAPRRG
jgi:hypothetical protein